MRPGSLLSRSRRRLIHADALFLHPNFPLLPRSGRFDVFVHLAYCFANLQLSNPVEGALSCGRADRLSAAALDEREENEITDLQQRLYFSKHEQSDDGWCRGWGFNKLLLAVKPAFSVDAHACVCVCVCEDAALIVAGCVKLKCCY